MNKTIRGQVLVIVAFFLPLALLLLAVMLDAGRIYIEQGRMRQAAAAAAHAGIGTVADQIVAHAALRQTQAAPLTTSGPGTPEPSPPPAGDPLAWLTDEDRADLVAAWMCAEVRAEALRYLELNGIEPGGPDLVQIEIEYPQPGFDPNAEWITVLSMRVRLERELPVLLAGLLNEEWVTVHAEAISQIPQR